MGVAPVNVFEGYKLFETPKAIRFWGHFWHGPAWLPKSQISHMEEDGDSTIVHASDWICGKKDVREFEECEPKDDFG